MKHDICYYTTREQFDSFLKSREVAEHFRCHRLADISLASRIAETMSTAIVVDLDSEIVGLGQAFEILGQTFPRLPIVAFCHRNNLELAMEFFPDYFAEIVLSGFEPKLFTHRVQRTIGAGRLELLLNHANDLANNNVLPPGENRQQEASSRIWPFAFRETDGEAIPSMEETERRYIQYVLESVEGNRTTAAKILGLDRKTLWRKLRRER